MADYDSAIRVVTLKVISATLRLVVINVNDVHSQVAFVHCQRNRLNYKVIAPYTIFNKDMKNTAGKLNYNELS